MMISSLMRSTVLWWTTRSGKHKRLRPGNVSPCQEVLKDIPRPPYVKSKTPAGLVTGPEVHDEKGIECMRDSGRLAAQVLQYAGTLVRPGITIDDIDQVVHQMIVDNGAYPSPLGYGDFPKSVCTSVNECIFHGIPDSRVLETPQHSYFLMNQQVDLTVVPLTMS
ncbi:methionine aminopeptidase 1D, chloroplastic/mitochondrial-like isoform X2 [Arachis hypogaea]|uniref:methionine aminopeptidase 1D, chloroplastic/mitochondrial-like isoform X2 n=2 Tax=Arachis hypogaea TaxID=3818 RepID=UPI003B2214AD